MHSNQVVAHILLEAIDFDPLVVDAFLMTELNNLFFIATIVH